MQIKNIRVLYVGNILSKHGVNLTNIETLGPLLESEGYKVIYTSSIKNKLFRYLDIIKTIIFNSYRVDIVLIDTYSTSAFYFALTAGVICKIFNIKYIPILHGGDLPKRIDESPLLCDFYFNNSYKNVVISDYLKNKLENKNIENLQLIPNNIEIDSYKFYHRLSAEPRLLWVRAFHEIYNPKLAILLVEKLVKKYPNTILTMVGPDKDGTLESCRQLVEELGLEKKVIFTGRLSKSDWHKLSEESDIFINTTNVDNLPVSVIESMALGLIPISTNVGGIPFLIEHKLNGLLVSSKNLEELYDSVTLILENEKLCSNISFNAREKALEYNWVNVKESWNNILNLFDK